jgi:cell division protein FtsL
MKDESYQLELEWGKLQLEHSTWSSYDRIEKLAWEKLEMRKPGPENTVLVVK